MAWKIDYFVENDVRIFNPRLSSCGREVVSPDVYGFKNEREVWVKVLSNSDIIYLREIRAENLDGSEPALGELLERSFELRQKLEGLAC